MFQYLNSERHRKHRGSYECSRDWHEERIPAWFCEINLLNGSYSWKFLGRGLELNSFGNLKFQDTAWFPPFLFEARMALRQMFHLIFSSISLLQTLRHIIIDMYILVFHEERTNGRSYEAEPRPKTVHQSLKGIQARNPWRYYLIFIT